jgi:hypothetical protein
MSRFGGTFGKGKQYSDIDVPMRDGNDDLDEDFRG